MDFDTTIDLGEGVDITEYDHLNIIVHFVKYHDIQPAFITVGYPH